MFKKRLAVTTSSKYTEEKTNELSLHINSLMNTLSKSVSPKIDDMIEQAYDLNIANHIPMERGVSAIKQWAESSSGDFGDVNIEKLIKQIGQFAEEIFNYNEVTEQLLAYQEILSKLNRDYTTASNNSNKQAILIDQTIDCHYTIQYNKGNITLQDNGVTVPLHTLSYLCKLSESDVHGEINDAFYERWVRTKILLSASSSKNNTMFAKVLSKYFEGDVIPYQEKIVQVFP